MVTRLYLSDIYPAHRDVFLTVAKMHGASLEAKPKGIKGRWEQVLYDLPNNPHITIPSSMEVDPYAGRDHYNHLSDDEFRLEVNSILLSKASGNKDEDPLEEQGPAKKAPAKKPVTRKKAVSADTVGTMPTKRGHDYFSFGLLRRRDRSYEENDKRKRLRIIYRGTEPYSSVLPATALESRTSLREWMDMATGDTDHRYTGSIIKYVHGVLIEGVDYNVDSVKLPVDFHPVALVNNQLKKGAKTRTKKPNSRAVTIKQRGYVVFNKTIITNFPDHETWLASQPVENISEEELLNRWREVILSSVTTERKGIESRLEELMQQCMEEERRLGQVALLERAARDNTNAAIKENIDKLRTIPEIDSFTPTDYGFAVVTKDMLMTREKTGEERYCGRFEIQVSMHGMVRIRNTASPREGFRNPHGSCIGSFGSVFGSALRIFDYYSLILAVMEYYRMVDSAHDRYFDEVPNNKKPPSKTYVSEWQDLVGHWTASGARDKIEQSLFDFNKLANEEDDEDEDDED